MDNFHRLDVIRLCFKNGAIYLKKMPFFKYWNIYNFKNSWVARTRLVPRADIIIFIIKWSKKKK